MVSLCYSKAIVKELEAERVRAQQLNNLRLYRIVQGLLWIGEGKSWSEVGKLLGVSVKTLDNWLRRLLVQGPEWLRSQLYQGRGCKSRLTPEQKQQVKAWVENGPQANGFSCGVWNTVMIAELIWRRLGVRYNPRYLSSWLKKLGLSYQKARFISDRCDEHEYERARRQWTEQTWPKLLEQAEKTGAVILFTDEVSFAMWGSLSRTWAPRGQQPLVKTRGIRKGLKMFGAISFLDGAFEYCEAHAYTLTPKALKQFKAEGAATEVMARLAGLKGHCYPSRNRFHQALDEVIGPEDRARYQHRLQELTEGSGRFNSASYIEFLQQLLARFDTPIILVEDSAPYHGSREVKQFKAEHTRLSSVSLPVFSPEFNPIEKLWRNTKKQATHLKYFKTFDELRASVLEVFRGFLDDATRVIRVMKKLRTEARFA